jgi:hypothetical protein
VLGLLPLRAPFLFYFFRVYFLFGWYFIESDGEGIMGGWVPHSQWDRATWKLVLSLSVFSTQRPCVGDVRQVVK